MAYAEIRFPAPPWRLDASLHASMWLVPAGVINTPCPPDCVPLRLGSRVIVAVGWARYSGLLSYNELLCGLVVLAKGWVQLHIYQIWVDDAQALAGGRALWGIPKEFADFTQDASSIHAHADGTAIASFRSAPRLKMPRWLPNIPIRGSTAQTLNGELRSTLMSLSGRLGLIHAEWKFPSTSPLSFLAGRKPFLSLNLTDARLVFGLNDPPAR